MRRDGSRTGIVVIGLLSVAVAAVVLKLMSDASSPAERGFHFWFALGFVLFLELVVAGLLVLPQLAAGRRELVAALYPSIGLATLLYAGLGMAATLLLFRSGSALYSVVVVLSLLYLLALGGLTTLYGHKGAGTAQRAAEERQTFEFSRRADEIYQQFAALRNQLDAAQYRPVESTMRRLAESFRFGLPFGRPGTAGAAAQLEAEIEGGLHDLWGLVDRYASAPADERPELLRRIDALAVQLLGVMQRREQSLVR